MAPVAKSIVAAFGAAALWRGAAAEDVEASVVAEDDECSALGSEEDRETCSLNAIQLRGLQVSGRAHAADSQCADLNDPANQDCASPVKWVVYHNGKHDPHAAEWFKDMKDITGVDYLDGTEQDFQRLYFCAPPGGKQCGKPPCTCTRPPCSQCSGEPQKNAADRPGCAENPDSISCKPPKSPMDYNGMAWPTLTYKGEDAIHMFAIGDWGGMDGSLNPIEGRPRIIAYQWGARPGPSVFPRTRFDKPHKVELCNHKQFIDCFNSHGSQCAPTCGYVKEIDEQPQQLVAKAMIERAAKKDPTLILNVGDNFYWGGIEKTCGTPMDQISYTAKHQFDQIFEGMYNGPGLDGKPWLSVLGNHDWGGRQFNNGWDQQIAYTWASSRWVMPAAYWMVHVDFPDQDFSMDIYLFDSNFNDAQEPSEDPEHNICGSAHNPPNANCGAIGGPKSIETCPQFFQDLWTEQKQWLEKVISKSTADWQVGVTHFPCGEDGEHQGFYRRLYEQHGLDFLVTGHRHDQEMWLPEDTGKNHMGGLTCIVTGGGGGITSEATPNPHDTKDWYGEAQYGFYDLTISKNEIFIESINWDGKVVKTATVHPK